MPHATKANLKTVGEQTRPPRKNNRRRLRAATRWIKRAVVAALAIGVIAAVVVAMLPKPVAVNFAVVTRGPLVVTVNEDGKTRVENRYVISSPLTGNMPRLGLLPGDEVKGGAVLVRVAPATPPLLDPRTRAAAQAQLSAALAGERQANAQVARARATYQQAESEAADQRQLADRGVAATRVAERAEFQKRASAEDLNAAVFGAKVVVQEVASARAALGMLRNRSQEDRPLEIATPVAGRVLRVLRKDEGLVAAGTPIVEIGDIASLEIVADVLTRDAVRITPGAPVSVVRWGGDTTLRAHVHRVEPSAFTRISALGVEEQRVNVVIDFDGPHERRNSLGDGFRVEVEITLWQRDDVLSVPASAVFRRHDGWAVFTVDGDQARLSPVQVGRRSTTRVQIISGLNEGDRVVLHPSDQVAEGTSLANRTGGD